MENCEKGCHRETRLLINTPCAAPFHQGDIHASTVQMPQTQSKVKTDVDFFE